MCVYVYAGTINRPLRLLTVCQNIADGLFIMQRTHGEWGRTHHETPTKHTANGLRSPTKWVANTPPGVGADSSCPYPNITKYAYPVHRIRVSISTYTHFHIIKYVYPFQHIRISTLLNMCIQITARTFPFPISWVFTYMRAR